MQLDGKRIIVTGGASGIAAATVRAFAREGAAVVSLDVNDAQGAEVADEASSLGGGPVTYRHCDITRRDEVDAVFDEEIARLGGIDALANIAGIEQQVPAEDVTEDDLDLMMGVHMKGTVFTNQAAFRAMRETGGSIINYSSFAGVRGFPGMPAYGAAKAATLGWTRIVAQDWGKHWVRVNAVCPAVLTPLAEQWFQEMSPERLAMVEESLARTIPLGGKLGTVDDAANLNVFLASDAARFITGQTIPVDGGQMMLS
jgi:NAD(P)-dependent dehydrogenase (short-subunit alcohol dehydrogenase family)